MSLFNSLFFSLRVFFFSSSSILSDRLCNRRRRRSDVIRMEVSSFLIPLLMSKRSSLTDQNFSPSSLLYLVNQTAWLHFSSQEEKTKRLFSQRLFRVVNWLNVSFESSPQDIYSLSLSLFFFAGRMNYSGNLSLSLYPRTVLLISFPGHIWCSQAIIGTEQYSTANWLLTGNSVRTVILLFEEKLKFFSSSCLSFAMHPRDPESRI